MSRIDTRDPEWEGNTPRRLPLWPLLAFLTLGSAAAPAQAYTTIDCPGSSSSSARGINDRGDIVGNCDDSSGSHGFLFRHGTFTMIDFPGATLTTGFGINNRGDVVGRYTDTDDVVHGYLLRHGHFSTIDPPGMIQGRRTAPNRRHRHRRSRADRRLLRWKRRGPPRIHLRFGRFPGRRFPGRLCDGSPGHQRPQADRRRLRGGEREGANTASFWGRESSRGSIFRAPRAPELRESTSSVTSSEGGATIPNAPAALRTHSCSRHTGSRTSRFPARSRPWPMASTTWARSWAPISARTRSSTGTCAIAAETLETTGTTEAPRRIERCSGVDRARCTHQ